MTIRGSSLAALVLAVGSFVPSNIETRPTSGRALGLDAESVHAVVETEGTRVAFRSGHVTLAATALRRGERRRPLDAPVAPVRHGTDVLIERGEDVTEWWRALETGLEHGVTIAARPEGEGEVTVEIAVAGELSARLASVDAVELATETGVVATYAELVVVDALGARLPSHMAATGDRIDLVFEDEGATYPVVVDPVLAAQEATLLAPTRGAMDGFGASVSVSADGTRVIVGAPDGTATLGRAFVYVRNTSSWSLEATLTVPGIVAGDAYGGAVAISGDGTRAIVTADNDDTAAGTDAGSAHVFIRRTLGWVLDETLAPTSSDAMDRFGASAAISSDGTRVAVGATGDQIGGVFAGSVHVFALASRGWTEEAVLSTSDAASGDALGGAVAISGDGRVVLAGDHLDDTRAGANTGSASVFVRGATGWVFDATLVAPDAAVGDFAGTAVALTADGTRALIGITADDTAVSVASGSARVFVRDRTGWSQEAVLTAPDGMIADAFGRAVALSSDASRALVTSFIDDTPGGTNAGSAWVFTRAGTTWSSGIQLRAPDGAADDRFGDAATLSADGGRAILGVPFDDTAPSGTDGGSARVFTLMGTTGTPCDGDATCTGGFCTDQICCSTRCAGGATDCQACSALLTGGVDGTCGTLSATVAPTTACRVSTGACDVRETCTSTSTACPPDLLAASGTVCRAATGACDVAETCSGATSACPANAVATIGTVCRVAANGCDVAESCDGTASSCPTDAFALAATACGGTPSGACDLPDHCAGTSASCVAVVAPPGTECRAASGACDLAEACEGTSPDCPSDLFAGATVICRASTALCDPEELCDGASALCAADVASCGDAGTDAAIDDAGTDAAIDDAGTDAAIDDAGTDAAIDDAGLDAGPLVDAARPDTGPSDGGARDASEAGPDASVVPPNAGGCACTVPTPSRGPGAAATSVALLVAMLVALRRRRLSPGS